MKKGRKAAKRFAEAVALARDEALVEIGEAAALRQEERTGRARRRTAGQWGLVALAAGTALTAGAVLLRRRRQRRKEEEQPITLSGKETPG